MQRRTFVGALAAAPLAATPPAAEVLFGDRAVNLENVTVDQGLWIQAKDLPRANGFTLKPEGACVDEICIPVPKSMTKGGRFHLTAFAKKIGQAEVYEPQAGVWSYGEIPVLRGARVRARHRAGLRAAGPQGTGDPAQQLQGQEGPVADLGVLVRMPPRSARVAENLQRTAGQELRDHRRGAGHGRGSGGGQVV